MSRDPLEELFGKLDSNENGSEETPTEPIVPAEPAAPAEPTVPMEQAMPAAAPAPAATPAPAPTSAPRNADAPTKQVPAAEKRSTAALPWIVVSIIAILALVGAFLFVNSLSDGDTAPVETDEPVAPEETDEPPVEETPEETDAPDLPEEAPAVDVGDTISLDIGYNIEITVEASQKLDPYEWYIPDTTRQYVTWSSTLMQSFPESCAAMRSSTTQSPWGIEQDETGTWGVVRPEGTCEADPELYNEVWGLMQAVADSAKPMERGSSED